MVQANILVRMEWQAFLKLFVNFKVSQSSNVSVVKLYEYTNNDFRFVSIPFEESNGATEVVKVEVKLAHAADIEAEQCESTLLKKKDFRREQFNVRVFFWVQ